MAGSHHGPAQRYPRVARINEVLREVVAEAIERLCDKEDALELLTVTGVECSTVLDGVKSYGSGTTRPRD